MKTAISLLLTLIMTISTFVGYESFEKDLLETPLEYFEYKENKNGGVTIVAYDGTFEKVVIPSEINGKPVTELGDECFGWRSDTTTVSVTLPNTLKTIGVSAFENCTSLEKIVLPETLTEIGSRAFYECTSLKHITIPSDCLKSESWETFACSGLETVELKEGVKYIPMASFLFTKIKEITLPSTVESIGRSAFHDCKKLEKVTLNNGLKSIDDGAFLGTKIKEVVIPKSVVSITEQAFCYCSELETVIFEGNAPKKYIDTNSFDIGAVYYTIYYRPGASGFTSPLWNGYRASEIGSEPDIKSYSDFDYTVKQDGSIILVKYTGNDADVVIPGKIDGKPVTEINFATFDGNSNIVSVKMPDTVTKIGYRAFGNCRSLKAIEFSKNLESIEPLAFSFCSNVFEVNLPDTVKRIGYCAFYECRSLTHISLPKNLVEVENNTFSGSMLESVELNEGLEVIGNVAFFGTKLRKVVLPSSVKVISKYAFSICEDLECVKLNENLKTIDEGAFVDCPKLTEIVIPASVKNVTELAFLNCNSLESVYFEGNAPSEYVANNTGLNIQNRNYTIYYHNGAEGFTSPEWCGYKTEIW